MANDTSKTEPAEAIRSTSPPIPKVPDKITIRLTPEVRLGVGRFIAREREKLEKAGSILSAPTAPDAVRALLEKGLVAVQTEENAAYMASRPLDQTRVQPASFVPNAPEFRAVAEVLAQSPSIRCGAQMSDDDNPQGRLLTYTCTRPEGHDSNHGDGERVWDNPCGSEIRSVIGDGSKRCRCSLTKGHGGPHKDHGNDGAEWYDRPAGGTFTHRKVEGGEGGMP